MQERFDNGPCDQTSAGPIDLQVQVIEYIADLLAQLECMASNGGLPRLAKKITTARLEAEKKVS